MALIVMLWMAVPARAFDLMRDAGIEHGLREIAAPVLNAAGLSPDRVKILVVDAGALNAFVVSNGAIFLHRGLIARATSAPMIQAVIAHEAAHIANGHIARRMTNMRSANTAAGFGLALATAAAAAGAGQVAGGLAIGTQSAAERRFLSHTRAEESSADQSGIRYLRRAGVDPRGYLEVLRLFGGQDVLSEQRQDPYVRSHPLTRARIRAVEAYVAGSPAPPPDAKAAYWFARVKGALTAKTRARKWTLGRVDEEEHADIRLMRSAIAHAKRADKATALRAIEAAIALRPKDAFYHALRGDILMQARQFGSATGAYSQAARYAPRDALIQAGLGRALLADGQTNAALRKLEVARSLDFRDGVMLRDLAVAYAKTDQTGMAALITAERYALSGRLKDAGIHATRAAALLDEGTGPWQRAQDVLNASERHAQSNRR